MCSACGGDYEYSETSELDADQYDSDWAKVREAVQRHLDSGRPEREAATGDARLELRTSVTAARKLRILLDHSLPDTEALRLTAQIDREERKIA
jgi:hypothetical protein